MTVKLHVGYIGKTRDGKRVEIVRRSDDDDTFCSSDEEWYHSNGARYFGGPSIIGPWVDEPAVGEWIGWNGGPCPVHPETVVEVVQLSGYKSPAFNAGSWGWDCKRSPIIVYRVVKEHKEPPKPREFWIRLRDDRITTSMPNHCDSDKYIHVREVLDT